MSKLSKTEETLVKKLLNIWNDPEFAAGIIVHLEIDDERQAMIDYIDDNADITTEELVLLSLHISNERGIRRKIKKRIN